MSFVTFVSGRYLRTRQKRAFISLITVLSIAGVSVGVMALIVVIAVMAGFESDLKQRIMGIRPHMVITQKTGDFDNYQRLIRQLTPTKGIETASAFISTQVVLRTDTRVAGAVMKGVQVTADASGISGVDTQLLASPSDTATPQNHKKKPSLPRIIIGKELAASLGVIRGDTVYIISPRGMLSPIGHMPAMVRFQVVDLFSSGMYEFDGTLCFVDLIQAQRMLKMSDSVSGIEIRVDNIDRVSQIAGKIESVIDGDYSVKDWKQLNRNLFSALRLEKTVMFIIQALIVLVAAFNIAGSLVMMVMEKRKDIAILKAMGATSRSIGRIFVIKGLMIGLMGIALGTSAGVGLCTLQARYGLVHLPADVYYITTLPVNLKLFDVLLIAVSALLICLAATLYPARQAARVNPVEAIRHG
ncbi:LolC1: lipoprotein-releasing system transmembrane protein [Desulfosarcina variabilis str. Montpellier]|uniref:lipoprotein-releasing ABC transporter permease subunit n=1 Tax=Desulfosarcina variabilis TaxID=2300 RepID=UPI003AFACBF6